VICCNMLSDRVERKPHGRYSKISRSRIDCRDFSKLAKMSASYYKQLENSFDVLFSQKVADFKSERAKYSYHNE
jgi:hypothetical protein